MATRASVNDPCRISDSESDEDRSPLRKNVPVTVFVGPSRGSQRTTPRVLDWQLEIEDEDQFGKQTPVAPPPTQKIKSNGKKFHGTPKLNSSTDRPPSARPSSSSSSSSSPNERADVVIANDESTAAPASPPATSTCDFDPYALIQENLSQFITTTIPEEFPGFIQCRLRRDTSGVQGNFLPTFYLQAEHGRDGRKLFLLAARRVAKVNRVAEYSITTNVESVSRSHRGDGYVGKLRGNNLSGTEYTLYDNGLSPNKLSKKKQSENQENLRRELAGIFYDTNVFGFKGPRQISVMLPKLGHTIQPSSDDQTINALWRHRRMNYLIQLRNKTPKYNEATKTYVIQFIGNRVVKPSVKNFQIVMEGDNKETVIMQFGRVDKDVFTCDFRYPLSAIQAFGIALSSFDSRIVRE